MAATTSKNYVKNYLLRNIKKCGKDNNEKILTKGTIKISLKRPIKHIISISYLFAHDDCYNNTQNNYENST